MSVIAWIILAFIVVSLSMAFTLFVTALLIERELDQFDEEE